MFRASDFPSPIASSAKTLMNAANTKPRIQGVQRNSCSVEFRITKTSRRRNHNRYRANHLAFGFVPSTSMIAEIQKMLSKKFVGPTTNKEREESPPWAKRA